MPNNIILCMPEKKLADAIGDPLIKAGYSVLQLADTKVLTNYLNASKADLLILEDRFNLSDIYNKTQNYKTPLPAPFIMISQKVNVHDAVKAMQAGASDYLPSTVDSRVLLHSVQSALQSNGNRDLKYKDKITENKPILTCSQVMQNLLKTALQVAASNATVLIQGESGTGKELLARYIHAHSGRASNSFIAMNCAALPENLAESELFGYEKGAFTGALRRKDGKFQQAHGGTLLLDEISEMALPLQAKLLRALQEKQVDPLGGTHPESVDARIVATTNLDLFKMVKQGQFREDLYYRLRVIPLKIPSLHARKEDIPLLIQHFLNRYTPPERTPKPAFTQGALKRLLNWPWPGNVRELENTVERAVLISNGPYIDENCLLLEDDLPADDLSQTANLVGLTVKDLEQKLIEQTLSHVNHNRSSAAKMLGISIRTLRNKLNEYKSSQSPSSSP
jgi:DNA-binding NtrC family response regulator